MSKARSKVAPAPVEPVELEWKRWAALALVDGESLADVIEAMVNEGIDEAEAAAVCSRFYNSDGGFEAARWTAQQLKKLESILTVRQELEALAELGQSIDRRSGLSGDEFLLDYYATNTPVILTDLCDTWPAIGRWTTDYLAAVFGDAKVEVMTGRDANPHYEADADDHRTQMPFATYVEQVLATEGNDAYMVANNDFLSTAVAEPLWRDFTIDPRYLNPEERAAYFWFGPAGTVTPLHHDAMNILFNQVRGRKRFRLVSPLETHLLYNNLSVYSDVDPLDVDDERFPLFEQARQIEFVIEPGESIFLPVGWWHHVESLDTSISVSFTNFTYPNDFELFDPDIAL